MQAVKRGDTLVEVLFAIAVFALVSVLALNIMSSGLKTAESAMEVAQTRSEIDAQAESLRYIHNAFTLERELVVSKQQYRDLWLKLSSDTSSTTPGMANNPDQLPSLDVDTCDEIYDGGDKSIFKPGLVAFVMNTREIDPQDLSLTGTTIDLDKIVVSTKSNSDAFTATQLYPRVLYSSKANSSEAGSNSDEELYETGDYRYVAAAEGMYIVAVRDRTQNASSSSSIPEFYDFHIRACWVGPNQNNPTTIGTTIRLYNPEIVENAQ
ncbi:prepilin-type N-terminal cleavage/methylation domain-containing protein [Candidatus Saccharibacteria bacterium]|nr:prepilin-type N-terminal cleavage/methylation domain-containing protein [Candidatus Saccharibacteria bacterium]